MEIAFYFYTILVMLVCIAAGTISLSAYFVCRKRSHLYMVAFFLFYFLDLALIFQNEYLGQNTEFPLEVFYAIDQPALRIFFALGILEALWLIALDFLGEKRMSMRIAPAVGFVVLSTVVIVALPEGQYKQWLFYSMRQVFLLWCLGYVLMRYRTTKSEIEKTRLRRHEPLFLITLVLTMCIILEDTFMMLVWDPTSVSMLPLYISERNFSENFLMLAFAFFSLREAGATLRLRFKEPPASENPEVRRQIDDLLPAYCERHGMTAREREILALVLQGKDNQNIASELQLALGTVKAHVHKHLEEDRPRKPPGSHARLLERVRQRDRVNDSSIFFRHPEASVPSQRAAIGSPRMNPLRGEPQQNRPVADKNPRRADFETIGKHLRDAHRSP